MGWRLEKDYPTRYGAFAMYGGTYRWLWMARLAKWMAELCPDLRDYDAVHIAPTPEAGRDG